MAECYGYYNRKKQNDKQGKASPKRVIAMTQGRFRLLFFEAPLRAAGRKANFPSEISSLGSTRFSGMRKKDVAENGFPLQKEMPWRPFQRPFRDAKKILKIFLKTS
jgi:hypothetical protein